MYMYQLFQEFALSRRVSIYGDSREPEPATPLETDISADTSGLLELLNRQHRLTRLGGTLSTRLEHTAYLGNSGADRILREWVDDWLDSGYEHGVENPRSRNFATAVNASLAVHEFSRKGKFRLRENTAGNGLAYSLSSHREPRLPGSIFEIQPTPEEFAQEQLVFMLLSELRLKLAKCRAAECGAYFLLRQWNKLFKRGCRCDDCRKTARSSQSVTLTQKARSEATETLQKLVAQRFCQQVRADGLWHTRTDLKKRIVVFLNREIDASASLRSIYSIRSPNGITTKWIARRQNWAQIERIILSRHDALQAR